MPTKVEIVRRKNLAHSGHAADASTDSSTVPLSAKSTVATKKHFSAVHDTSLLSDAQKMNSTMNSTMNLTTALNKSDGMFYIHLPHTPQSNITDDLLHQRPSTSEDHSLPEHFTAVSDASSLSEAQRLNSTTNLTEGLTRSNKSMVLPTGHLVPWSEGHWHWSDKWHMLVFESNNGLSQQRMEPQMYAKKGVGTDKDMVMAVDTTPGVNLNFLTNSINNEKELRDAEYYDGGKWVWKKHGKEWEVHTVPKWNSKFNGVATGITKYTHRLWDNASAHPPSAYEPDYFRDESEWFGPFRLDYHTHTVWVEDWNFRISSKASKPGHGNFAVGPDQYLEHATNSFVSGRRNVGRGDSVAVLGGAANLAKGDGSVVVGGEGNVANAKFATVAGGFHDYARGDYSLALGGSRDMAEGESSAVIGGRAGLNEAKMAVIAGGNANSVKSVAQYATIAGGTGNKVAAPYSVIRGGAGGMSKKRFEVITGVMPLSDMAIEDAMKSVEKKMDNR